MSFFLVELNRPRYSPYSNRSSANSVKTIKPKVFIANLNQQNLRGTCFCFIRNSNKIHLTEQNVSNVKHKKRKRKHYFSLFCCFFCAKEINFYTFETTTDCLLQSLSQSISDVYLPYFQSSDMIWSKENNQLIKNHFLNDLTNFIETLTTAQESINDRILLKSSDEIDLTQIQNTSDYVAIAANNENLATVEELMRTWIRQMEQVKKKKLK